MISKSFGLLFYLKKHHGDKKVHRPLPSIIQLADKDFYAQKTSLVWWVTFCLAIIPSITALKLSISPFWNRAFRTIGFYIFQTKHIVIFLIVQLLVVLVLLLVNGSSMFEIKSGLFSIGLNLIALNLLIAVGKISNSDKRQLILHTIEDGRIYLQSNNRLRYVPDPSTFDLLGLSWSDLIDIKKKDLASYHQDAPFPSIKDMQLISYRGRVYGIVNDSLRHVPNEGTLNFILINRVNKQIEERQDIHGYQIATPFAKVS